ncbi:dihydroneopterin aldolase domain protein [Aspergillus bertholletiae]|uniref:dihydroneopterin aldolase n=1 Tax=Aspergillus bertholletiae TaxID=1226010 RepID=A0A5N7BMD6_9EURO|nr:dihydroneopterin aldolase domain protein [Aspergillus bertholletiae]
MSQSTSPINITPRPIIADTIQLRNIQLQLPTAPDPWHRLAKPQPCSACVRLSYASSVSSAQADDVSQTIDYGKLFRRVLKELESFDQPDTASTAAAAAAAAAAVQTLGSLIIGADGTPLRDRLRGEIGEDIRLVAAMIAMCSLQSLEETAQGASSTAATSSPAVRGDYGEFEVQLQLPKAVLRARRDLLYSCNLALGTLQEGAAGVTEQRLVLLHEKFEIRGIQCYCILGINPWERVEKQAVDVSLTFKGHGLQEWGSTVVDVYQELVRHVAERVESTSFQSVEALAMFIARIVTVEFGNNEVTVLVEKPSALSFVDGSGLEITRSRSFFQ